MGDVVTLGIKFKGLKIEIKVKIQKKIESKVNLILKNIWRKVNKNYILSKKLKLLIFEKDIKWKSNSMIKHKLD